MRVCVLFASGSEGFVHKNKLVHKIKMAAQILLRAVLTIGVYSHLNNRSKIVSITYCKKILFLQLCIICFMSFKVKLRDIVREKKLGTT